MGQLSVVTRHAERGASVAPWRAISWSLLLVPLTALFVLLAAAFAAEWAYADRALPGVTVAGVQVGSLTRDAAVARLQAELARPWADGGIVASYGGRTWRTTNGAAGIAPDVAAAADAALVHGKRGSVLDRALAWLDTLQGEARLPLAFRADGDGIDTWVAGIAAEIDRPAVSGSLAVGASGLVATEPVVGAQLDRAAAASTVLAVTSLGERQIDLSVRRMYPEVDESGFREAFLRAQAITTPLSLVVEDRRVNEDPAGLARLLVIERVTAKPGELAPVPAGATAPERRAVYTTSLDHGRLTEWVAALAAKLDRPGVNDRYAVSREGALAVVPGVTGIRVDQERLAALLVSELQKAGSGAREIAAPTVADPTAFTTDQATEWLPKLARTSSFTTVFPPNASRHANIATGSAQFDGVVILPGNTFSFWELLGPVTTERGYAYAGAIIDNRSDENVIGGGLCQVSTTMFNAVAKLGYEIVERHAHGYLIERYPIGLDAAVFLPGSDLRWRNDTTSPVFLWSWVGDTSVTFEVWGVPTGRTVTFSAPVQRSFVPVPKDQAADPAFPAGYALAGRDVIVTRTVTEGDGKVLHQDTFFSRYAPVWGGPAPTPQEDATAEGR
ncbi:MAG: VanW family protein [Chloroflexi bacterium]|nr:VanW family protein [Chloroflexota bacterium]